MNIRYTVDATNNFLPKSKTVEFDRENQILKCTLYIHDEKLVQVSNFVKLSRTSTKTLS